jgi:ATP-dependent RNA helicase DeaD
MAFTFVSGREIYQLQGMIRYARLQIRRENIPSLDEVEQAKGNVFYERLRATLEEKKFKSHDQMVDRLLGQGYTSTDIASALIHLMQGETAEPVKKTTKARAESIAANEAPVGKPAGASAPLRPISPTPARREASPPEPKGDKFAAQKRTYERKPRTGREPGFSVVSFNVGRQHLITPADLVGKIAGVTRLPAHVVGAIDIHEDHTHVDVATEHVDMVVAKLAGIRIKNQSLKLAVVPQG